MSTMSKPLEDLVQELAPEMRDQVRDFVEFLLSKRGPHSPKPLRQDWAGALRDYRQQYTSLELEGKAMEWRGN